MFYLKCLVLYLQCPQLAHIVLNTLNKVIIIIIIVIDRALGQHGVRVHKLV